MKEKPLEQVPLDRVTQRIFARIHATVAPQCEEIAEGRSGAEVVAGLFTMFRHQLPSLDSLAYSAVRGQLGKLAAALGQLRHAPLSAATRALAGQLAGQDLPRLAAIATKLSEEEELKHFAASRETNLACGESALAARKKTTIRRADFEAAIDRIVSKRLQEMAQLIKQDTAEWFAGQGVTGESVGLAGDGGGPRYGLRKESRGWALVLDGRPAMLPGWKGLDYVAYLLVKAPGEAIHGIELGERVCGDAVIEGQRNLAADDEESFEGMRRAKRECQGLIDDADSSEAEREEARAEMVRIEEWARKHMRGTEGGEQKQVRAIRQAIRRVLESLEESKDEVWRLFGEHLDRHLWKPSGRSRGGRSARVRAGLAGRFIYEPPDGVKWSG